MFEQSSKFAYSPRHQQGLSHRHSSGEDEVQTYHAYTPSPALGDETALVIRRAPAASETTDPGLRPYSAQEDHLDDLEFEKLHIVDSGIVDILQTPHDFDDLMNNGTRIPLDSFKDMKSRLYRRGYSGSQVDAPGELSSERERPHRPKVTKRRTSDHSTATISSGHSRSYSQRSQRVAQAQVQSEPQAMYQYEPQQQFQTLVPMTGYYPSGYTTPIQIALAASPIAAHDYSMSPSMEDHSYRLSNSPIQYRRDTIPPDPSFDRQMIMDAQRRESRSHKESKRSRRKEQELYDAEEYPGERNHRSRSRVSRGEQYEQDYQQEYRSQSRVPRARAEEYEQDHQEDYRSQSRVPRARAEEYQQNYQGNYRSQSRAPRRDKSTTRARHQEVKQRHYDDYDDDEDDRSGYY